MQFLTIFKLLDQFLFTKCCYWDCHQKLSQVQINHQTDFWPDWRFLTTYIGPVYKLKSNLRCILTPLCRFECRVWLYHSMYHLGWNSWVASVGIVLVCRWLRVLLFWLWYAQTLLLNSEVARAQYSSMYMYYTLTHWATYLSFAASKYLHR